MENSKGVKNGIKRILAVSKAARSLPHAIQIPVAPWRMERGVKGLQAAHRNVSGAGTGQVLNPRSAATARVTAQQEEHKKMCTITCSFNEHVWL